MKLNLITTMLLAVVISAVGCKKDSSETKNNSVPVVDKQVIEEVRLMNRNDQRVALSILQPDQRYVLFIDNIDGYLNSGKSNEAQTAVLKELRNKLTPEIFSPSEAQDHFKFLFAQQWLEKAKAVFTYETLADIVINIRPLTVNRLSVMDVGGEGTQKNCNCDTKSFFTCSMQAAKCESSKTCRYVTSNCGFLAMYQCDGLCSNEP